MKKVALSVGGLILALGLFSFGFYSGSQLGNYDFLCEKDFGAHKLLKEFRSENGLVIPQNTVVYLRGCKPNTAARLEFFIDNWNYQYTERLQEDPYPTYYLGIVDKK